MKILILDSFSPESSTLRLAADSAWRPDRRPLFVPEGLQHFDLSLHLAVRISRLGKGIAAAFAHRYYDAWALAVLPRLGQPHTLVADDSIVLGAWQPLGTLPVDARCGDFAVALRNPGEPLHQAIASLSRNMTFKTGDVLILPPSLLSVAASPGQSFIVSADAAPQPLIQFNIR